MTDALESNPYNYKSFNAFFTRELKPGARPVASGKNNIISPVDGTICQIGSIEQGQIIIAKGKGFSVAELVGHNTARDLNFSQGGEFAVIYLSPANYHRVHIPLAGRLRFTRAIPGRLLSVQSSITTLMPEVFSTNERLLTLFDTDFGQMAMVLVGATFVGGIETKWDGCNKSFSDFKEENFEAKNESLHYAQGSEIARFNFGSTVILLFPRGMMAWDRRLFAGTKVKVGESMGYTLH